ncbi:hypothetical protein ABE021_11475 [Sporosarcina gallistercoris]|uniref:hypothetical protein n=1 Tax=Sporosarcina gallistercoris TaxID=2762245 RepID=UPI003D295D8B
MNIKSWIPFALIMSSFTIIMAYDFFPGLNNLLSVPKQVIILLMLLIVLLGFFVTRLRKTHSPKSDLLWSAAFMSYLFVLILVFTLIGGVSQVGLSLSSPVLWLVIAISVIELIREVKNLRVEETK